MAVVVSSRETKAPSISDLTIVNSGFKCICCQLRYCNLKQLKQIIEILSRRDKIYCTEHHSKHTR